jgi:multidrug resistance efflux pump
MSALSSQAPAPPVQAPPKPNVTPHHPPPKRRGWLIGLILVVVVGVAAWYTLGRTKTQTPATAGPAIRTAKAFVGALPVVLRVSGQTSARQYANITMPIMRGPEARGPMTLVEVAKSGSFVKKGEVVVRIDAQNVLDHVDDLKDTIQAAENDVSKQEAQDKVDWENLQQTLRVAKANLDKAKLDHSAGEVKTEVERELLKLAMDEAEARYQEQQKDLAFRRTSQTAQLNFLKLTLKRHQEHMGRHAHDIDKFNIKAAMDGLVVMQSMFTGGDMRQVQQGDQVAPGQPIMKIVNLNSMQVEASVSQSDSGELRLNQVVDVGLDAFPDLKFKGKVYSIGALAAGGFRQNYYIRSVPVKIAVEGADARLIPDLSAYGNVHLGTLPDQLQIPIAAVKEENGKATVEVKTANGFQTKQVVLGKRNMLNVAVTAGLSAGEEVRVLN